MRDGTINVSFSHSRSKFDPLLDWSLIKAIHEPNYFKSFDACGRSVVL